MAQFATGSLAVVAYQRGLFTTGAILVMIGCWQLRYFVQAARTVDPGSAQLPVAPKDGAADVQRDGSVNDLAVLRIILDETPLPMLVFTPARPARTFNRAARRLFAGSAGLADFVARAGDGSAKVEFGDFSFRIDRIEVVGEETAQTIWVLVEVGSEVRRAEARATRELLQVLSHEVMNAVTPITSLAQTATDALAATEPDVAELRDVVGTLGRRAAALQDFTQAYRQLARLPEPSLANIALEPVLRDLERAFVAKWQKRVRLEIAADQDDIRILADASQVFQAVWAVMQNAAEASLEADRPAVVRLAMSAQPSPIIRITDTGPGIAVAVRASIFHNFYTTKPGGNGVGLSIAQQIARAHGGDVRLATTAPTGSSFEFYFPARI